MQSYNTLLIIFLVILGFFVCREILCWYWKINKVVVLLSGILEEIQIYNGTSHVKSGNSDDKSLFGHLKKVE